MLHRAVHLQHILNLSQHDTNFTSILESGYQRATFKLSQFDRIYFKRNKQVGWADFRRKASCGLPMRFRARYIDFLLLRQQPRRSVNVPQ